MNHNESEGTPNIKMVFDNINKPTRISSHTECEILDKLISEVNYATKIGFAEIKGLVLGHHHLTKQHFVTRINYVDNTGLRKHKFAYYLFFRSYSV